MVLFCQTAEAQNPNREFTCKSDEPLDFIYTLNLKTEEELHEHELIFQLFSIYGNETIHKKIIIPFNEEQFKNEIENIEIQGSKGSLWETELFEAMIIPSYLAGFTSLKIQKQYEVIRSSFPSLKSELFIQDDTGGLRFRFGKDRADLLKGNDVVRFNSIITNDEHSEQIQFELDEELSKPSLPDIIPIFYILRNKDNPNELKFIAKIKNKLKTEQQILVALQWIPMVSDNLKLEIIRFGDQQQIVAPGERNRLVIRNKNNESISLLNGKERWKIEIMGPNNYIKTALIPDLRPVLLYVFQIVEDLLEPEQELVYEWKLRITFI